jgi:uncharacterized BrkB/YihY/UPF0761 family membrane protein
MADTDLPAPPDASEETVQLSRYRRARARFDNARQTLEVRGKELEARLPAARAAVRVFERDRAVGGEIMAGAIAFRLFVFLLPLVLVVVIVLGIAADASSDPDEVAKTAGITGLAAQSVSESARSSSGGRWIALFLGLVALYSTSRALARALRIAHALAWGGTYAPMKRTWRASLIVIGASLVVVGVTSGVSRIRAATGPGGFLVAILGLFVYAGLWFAISLLLPHGDADWKALIPGALLVGVGVEILHLVTVFYISGRVSSASKLYGPLGAAVAILFWAYLVGRLTVSSAILNATLFRRETHTARQELRLTGSEVSVGPEE